jgi:hypothetical protein
MGGAYCMCGEKYRVLVRNHKGKRLLGKPRYKLRVILKGC